MIYKYSVLKSSWGIVVFLELEELINPLVSETDIKISDFVYLRISNEAELRLRKDIIRKWIGLALKNSSNKIYEMVQTSVCINVKSIDFNLVDFQEEGLYCATIGWLSEYYELQLPEVVVEFNREKNVYEFDINEK